MSDPGFNYVKTTATKKRAAALASMRYLHVSVLVGTAKQDIGNGFTLIVPTRTPKGKGGTARKNPDVAKIINAGRHRRELRRAARSAD